MQTSLILTILSVVVLSVLAFCAGRITSTASVARRRYSQDAGKAPMWLKNYKSNGYTRTVYEKVLKHFKADKPFLNPELTVEDVARHIGTNKSYVAKALKIYSGRNFCQFVNSFRLEYAMEQFRLNPSLRVNEMGAMSGFNSPTSFSMSFKMLKGMPPGEWCRRYRLSLKKK